MSFCSSMETNPNKSCSTNTCISIYYSNGPGENKTIFFFYIRFIDELELYPIEKLPHPPLHIKKSMQLKIKDPPIIFCEVYYWKCIIILDDQLGIAKYLQAPLSKHPRGRRSRHPQSRGHRSVCPSAKTFILDIHVFVNVS